MAGAPPTAASGLADLVVLELAAAPGACFAGTLLADFNATVVVCEPPPAGSAMRRLRPGGGDDWWQVLGRNKRSLALDPLHPGARGAVAALVELADLVIVEGGAAAPEGWAAAIAGARRPPLVLDLHATGADRPADWGWSCRPELTAAATGMMALTGWQGAPPVQPEAPIAEYLGGMMAALQAVAALRRRRLDGGSGGTLPVAMHEAVQRMIEWQVPVAAAMGRPELRDGNSFPMAAGISNMHRTRDGAYVAISAATQAVAERLLEMVGGEALRSDPRFADQAARRSNMPLIYAAIDDWVGARTAAEVMAVAAANDVVLGPIHTVDDILRDPQVIARNLVAVPADGGRTIPMPDVLPRLSSVETAVHHAGPAVGADTDMVLRRAGLSRDEIGALRRAGAIWA